MSLRLHLHDYHNILATARGWKQGGTYLQHHRVEHRMEHICITGWNTGTPPTLCGRLHPQIHKGQTVATPSSIIHCVISDLNTVWRSSLTSHTPLMKDRVTMTTPSFLNNNREASQEQPYEQY